MRRFVIVIYLIINTFCHLLAVDNEDTTLELHFIYLVISNESILQQNDIALIESSRSYKIEEIIQDDNDYHDTLVIPNVGSLPSDKIYDNGFCVPTGNFTNCFVLDGVMTIKASGSIDDAITRFYEVAKYVMNNGFVFLPFDGIIFYHKATEQTSTIYPPSPVKVSTRTAIMLPILVSIGAFLSTAAIMYFICYHDKISSSKRSSLENELEDDEGQDERLGIRANDLLVTKTWVALKLPFSLCSFSVGSLASEEHSLPQILTTSISSDCCSSVSDISAKDKETVADCNLVNLRQNMEI